MKHEEVEVGKKYWTMIANKPFEVEVIHKYSYLGHRFRRINVYRKCDSGLKSRHAEELFKTREALKNHVFPELK